MMVFQQRYNVNVIQKRKKLAPCDYSALGQRQNRPKRLNTNLEKKFKHVHQLYKVYNTKEQAALKVFNRKFLLNLMNPEKQVMILDCRQHALCLLGLQGVPCCPRKLFFLSLLKTFLQVRLLPCERKQLNKLFQ